MIQRIQTVYLLMVFCLMVAMLFLPVASNISYDYALSVDVGIIAILSLVTIFLYKKRKTQLKLCYLITIFILAYYGFLVVKAIPFKASLAEYGFSYPIFFPALALLLVFLAKRGIKHDEKLVRSYDRLR